MAFRIGNQSALDRMRSDLDKQYRDTRANIASLTDSGFLDSAYARGALSKLDKAYQHAVRRFEHYIPFDMIPVGPLPPPVSRLRLRGIVAYREWELDEGTKNEGILRPLFQGYVAWNSIMFADAAPTKDNSHGLHAISLHPSCLDRLQYNTINNAFGFVELLGHVEIHSDGVIRAECAKMLEIYVPVIHDEMNLKMRIGLFEEIQGHYPTVPVHLVTDWQAKLIKMREILISCGVSTY